MWQNVNKNCKKYVAFKFLNAFLPEIPNIVVNLELLFFINFNNFDIFVNILEKKWTFWLPFEVMNVNTLSSEMRILLCTIWYIKPNWLGKERHCRNTRKICDLSVIISYMFLISKFILYIDKFFQKRIYLNTRGYQKVLDITQK